MTQKEMCEAFEKIQKYIESSEFKENATKVIKEYINKNFTDIESLVLGDKNSKNILNEKGENKYEKCFLLSTMQKTRNKF